MSSARARAALGYERTPLDYVRLDAAAKKRLRKNAARVAQRALMAESRPARNRAIRRMFRKRGRLLARVVERRNNLMLFGKERPKAWERKKTWLGRLFKPDDHIAFIDSDDMARPKANN